MGRRIGAPKDRGPNLRTVPHFLYICSIIFLCYYPKLIGTADWRPQRQGPKFEDSSTFSHIHFYDLSFLSPKIEWDGGLAPAKTGAQI